MLNKHVKSGPGGQELGIRKYDVWVTIGDRAAPLHPAHVLVCLMLLSKINVARNEVVTDTPVES